MYRTAYFAGTWYPENERDCRAAIEGHAAETEPEQASWRALVGPHAGWVYSGDAAGRAYRWLASAQQSVDLVVIFGSHRGPRGPNTLFRDDGFATPLGRLETSHDVVGKVSAELELADEPVRPVSPDNGVEVHLPFVRYFFERAELIVLGVAASLESKRIGDIVGRVCKDAGRETVFIGSTDLTHYGPNYGFTPEGIGKDAVKWVREHNDRGFIDRTLEGDIPGLIEHAATNQSACCSGAVAATVAAAAVYGDAGQSKLVGHYLSYDVTPGPSFVGYAGIVL